MSLFSTTPQQDRKAELQEFQRSAGIKFKNLDLLDLAFHHRSFSNESQQHVRLNNERLEFLGDAVLGMVTASHLYESMEDKPEGDLAKTKAVVVSEPVLSEIALRLGIDKCLILGKGEEQSGGRKKKAILADAMEAVIGAYYLDSGFFRGKFMHTYNGRPVSDRYGDGYRHKFRRGCGNGNKAQRSGRRFLYSDG